MPRLSRQHPSDAVTDLYERAVVRCERHELGERGEYAEARVAYRAALGLARRRFGPDDLDIKLQHLFGL